MPYEKAVLSEEQVSPVGHLQRYDMFRIVVSGGKSQVARVNSEGTFPAQGGGWLRQLGIALTTLLLLPVALFSFAVFLLLFLAVIGAALTYAFWFYSRLQREKARGVIQSEYEVVHKAGAELRLSNGDPLDDDSPGDISSKA